MQTAVLTGYVADEKKRVATALPLHCLLAVIGATCIPLGALWDISWHSTIGRDTFWTPAHIMIHIGGLLPGLTAGWLVLKSTFWGTPEDRNSTVRLFGFRGPIGAWVIIWGAFAMLFSAPFDDWWHNAYGLDVAILSPPHTILAAGMYAVAIGSLLLVLAYQNRSGERAGSLLFVYLSGVLLVMASIIITEKSYPNHQHGSMFYKLCCAIYPTYLAAVSRAAKVRWAATGAALVYMAMICMMVWILPLFEARPMLAPIYNPVDHMVPPNFPLLLVVPALGIDLLIILFKNRRGFWWDFVTAACIGTVFLGALLAVQYPFSKFLLGPGAENWFFAGNRHWPYFVKLSEWRTRFWDPTNDPLTMKGLGIALGLALFKSRIALALGNWMSKVQR